MIQKQSGFDRTLYNEAKCGAYYTETGHCKRIGKLFHFQGETCVLEPSIGDGTAVEAFLNTVKKPAEEKVYVFGVELREEAKKEAESRTDYCLQADFLTGVRISNKSFSVCFANPPYMNDEVKGERVEQRFVEKLSNYVKTDGYLVLIVPFSTLLEEKFAKSLLSRFQFEGLWKFDENEYKKYKQLVFIGRRKKHLGIFSSDFKSFQSMLDLDFIPELPQLDEEVAFHYEVPESEESKVEIFMELEFHPEQFYQSLEHSPIYEMLGEHMFIEPYAAMNIGKPVLPLKKDLTYLCAVAGGGQGMVGTEENHDVHLQRGVAKVIEESEYDTSENTDRVTAEKVCTRTQISLNVIENDGNIRILV